MTTVRIASGKLLGSIEDGIHSFKGIPYAEPLTGRARWLPPRPRGAWDGVRDAQSYGAACMQFNDASKRLYFPRARRRYMDAIRSILESEEGDDCLLLNVFTPSVDANARLPVMLWIHGGSFTSGVANAVYDGTRFAREGVVLVVIQYRLGPPGFLHGTGLFDGEFCADNRAFLDQVCALQWVRQNIAAFGGDAGNVTIFGESAGAFAVYQLAASPLAKGLFRRAIALGGMANTCGPATEYRMASADALADFGVKRGDADALAALDRTQLRKLHANLTGRIFRNKNQDQYGSLSRERVGFMGAATGTEFLPRAPLKSYAHGTPNNIELMLGNCANDGGLFSHIAPFGRAVCAKMFSKQLTGLVPNGDLEAARAYYRQQMPKAGAAEVYEQLNQDAFYRWPTLRAAEAHAKGNPGKTWHFQIDYRSGIPGLGAIHAIDVALLFRTEPVTALLREDEATENLSALLLAVMVNFARSGAPAAPGMPAWPAFDAASRATMVFDDSSRVVADIDAHLRRYW